MRSREAEGISGALSLSLTFAGKAPEKVPPVQLVCGPNFALGKPDETRYIAAFRACWPLLARPCSHSENLKQ
jgi:hypothetical protein